MNDEDEIGENEIYVWIFIDLHMEVIYVNCLNISDNCMHVITWINAHMLPLADYNRRMTLMGQWPSYQICKIVGCACAGNGGDVFPATAG